MFLTSFSHFWFSSNEILTLLPLLPIRSQKSILSFGAFFPCHDILTSLSLFTFSLLRVNFHLQPLTPIYHFSLSSFLASFYLFHILARYQDSDPLIFTPHFVPPFSPSHTSPDILISKKSIYSCVLHLWDLSGVFHFPCSPLWGEFLLWLHSLWDYCFVSLSRVTHTLLHDFSTIHFLSFLTYIVIRHIAA